MIDQAQRTDDLSSWQLQRRTRIEAHMRLAHDQGVVVGAIVDQRVRIDVTPAIARTEPALQ